MRFLMSLLNRLACAAVLAAGLAAIHSPAQAQGVQVQGNRRVDTETIRSYFSGSDQAQVNQGVKELLATNLFSDVRSSIVSENVGVADGSNHIPCSL